jgi:hypothetical protein
MKKLLLAFLCLGISTTVFAQFNAILINVTPLTHGCDGTGGPISHGYLGYIWWDQNNNGPDPSDILPVVGGGFGQCNFNQIDMGTGEDLLGIPGGFATDPAFTIGTNTPQPSRYFVTVTGNSVIWTSAVFTIENGLNDLEVGGWTCEQIIDTCSATLDFPMEIFDQDPNNHRHRTFSTCIWLCAGTPKYLLNNYDYPLSGSPHYYATVTGGCGSNTACESDLESPAANPLWSNGSQAIALIPYFGQAMPINTDIDGWVCLYIDLVLPVEHGSFDAVAGDQIVNLNWNTLAETDVDHFNVLRKRVGESEYSAIANIPAENSVSGANYSYVDHNVVNGTTYIYSLSVSNLDGSTQEWGSEVTATPTAAAAVITDYALLQNYPNPFNSVTNFVFDMLAQNTVTLNIYNIHGELVSEPINGTYSAGRHTISYDANSLATGLYFYTLNIGNGFSATHKMLLIK